MIVTQCASPPVPTLTTRCSGIRCAYDDSVLASSMCRTCERWRKAEAGADLLQGPPARITDDGWIICAMRIARVPHGLVKSKPAANPDNPDNPMKPKIARSKPDNQEKGEPRPGTMNERALRLVRESGAAGLTVAQLHAECGLSDERKTQVLLSALGARKLVVRFGHPREYGRYFAAGVALPALEPRPAKPAKPVKPPPVKPQRVVQLHSLTKVKEKPVKIVKPVEIDYSRAKRTVCPAAVCDPRYQVAPGDSVSGAGFVAEWRAKTGGI